MSNPSDDIPPFDRLFTTCAGCGERYEFTIGSMIHTCRVCQICKAPVKTGAIHQCQGFSVEYVDHMPNSTILAAKPEAVDHPAHYGGEDDPFEHIKVCEAQGWGYHLGQVTKYIWRLGKKVGTSDIEDLQKARWYLDRLIQHLCPIYVPKGDPTGTHDRRCKVCGVEEPVHRRS